MFTNGNEKIIFCFVLWIESNWLETNEKNSEFFNCKITKFRIKLCWAIIIRIESNGIQTNQTIQYQTHPLGHFLFNQFFPFFFSFFFSSSLALFPILSLGCALFVYLPNESSLKYLYFVSLLKSFSVVHLFYYFPCTAHNSVWKRTWKSFGVQHSTAEIV